MRVDPFPTSCFSPKSLVSHPEGSSQALEQNHHLHFHPSKLRQGQTAPSSNRDQPVLYKPALRRAGSRAEPISLISLISLTCFGFSSTPLGTAAQGAVPCQGIGASAPGHSPAQSLQAPKTSLAQPRGKGNPALLQLLTLILCLCKRLVPSLVFAKARGVGTVARSWPLMNQKANRRRTSATWELLCSPGRSSQLLQAPHASLALLGDVLSWWKGLCWCCFQFFWVLWEQNPSPVLLVLSNTQRTPQCSGPARWETTSTRKKIRFRDKTTTSSTLGSVSVCFSPHSCCTELTPSHPHPIRTQGMASYCHRAGLEGISGRNSWL